MIVALCGGVGGSKLALGLYRTLPPGELTVIVNTADDLEFCGLHVSPDLDTATYTLAGLSRSDVGWGIEGDTSQALEMLARYGAPTWFEVGDRDLATHVIRTQRLRGGDSLTDVTLHIARSLGVRATVLPMTDGSVATRLLAGDEWIDFQDYFVRRRHAVPVSAVRYEGIEGTPATERVRGAIGSAEAIVLVNSNPVLSILPILETPGINDLVASSSAPRVAVSPIVGRDAVSGPAGELMRLIGQPASATGVANTYLGVIDGIVIDRRDADQEAAIEALGLAVVCTDTIMRDIDDRERLAAATLAFANELRR
jgi:LPPG:FO 2-phospho-L-lactate transferase